jgi:hypothetical protein
VTEVQGVIIITELAFLIGLLIYMYFGGGGEDE